MFDVEMKNDALSQICLTKESSGLKPSPGRSGESCLFRISFAEH